MNTVQRIDTELQPKTRERILIEASKLFSEAGYMGTSTRDIADAVGIKQPGLYSHFGSKAEVFAALAQASLDPMLELVAQEKKLKNSSPVELARLLRGIAYSIAYSSYNSEWMFGPVPLDPEFFPLWQNYLALTNRLEAIVAKGKKSGAFRNISPSIGQEILINNLSVVMWSPLALMADWRSNKKLRKRVDDLVKFALFGIMANASEVEGVFEEADFEYVPMGLVV